MNILFVCTGNICRSPLAEGILKKEFTRHNIPGDIDSAGFEPFHNGDQADERAIRIAREFDTDITGHRARLFSVKDFDLFDKIYVMDTYHFQNVRRLARKPEDIEKVDYIMNVISPGQNEPVEDPYYESYDTFRRVYQQLQSACLAMAQSIIKKGYDEKR